MANVDIVAIWIWPIILFCPENLSFRLKKLLNRKALSDQTLSLNSVGSKRDHRHFCSQFIIWTTRTLGELRKV